MSNLLDAEFRDLVSKVFNEPVEPEQLKDMRRCFYAGALVAVMNLERHVAIDAECKQFADEVRAGRQ